jgi:hypothetical protein
LRAEEGKKGLDRSMYIYHACSLGASGRTEKTKEEEEEEGRDSEIKGQSSGQDQRFGIEI